MTLSSSNRAHSISQAEIRVMTIECERVGGINLAQGVCDTEVPLAVRRGAQFAVGYSKTFSITGWRVGYSVSDARWANMIGYMNDLVYVCAPAPLQYGVAAGIAEPTPDFYRELVAEYARKRNRICGALEKVGLPPCVPQGAYYVLADVSRLPGTTSKAKAMYMLAQTGVASVPGEAFFHRSGGENLVRFCFAKTDSELEEACLRLEQLT